RGVEPRAPELLAEAAADAATRGAPEAAARFLHRALDEPIDATTRAALTFELARAEFAAGGARAAEEAARGAARLSQDPRARARAELILGRALYAQARHGEAAAAFQGGLSQVDDESHVDLAHELRATY